LSVLKDALSREKQEIASATLAILKHIIHIRATNDEDGLLVVDIKTTIVQCLALHHTP